MANPGGKGVDPKEVDSCCESSHLDEKVPHQSDNKGNMQIGETDAAG
jgi:hypothetical protein